MRCPELSRMYLEAKLNLLQQLPKECPCLQFHAFPIFLLLKPFSGSALSHWDKFPNYSAPHIFSHHSSLLQPQSKNTHSCSHVYMRVHTPLKTIQLCHCFVWKSPQKFCIQKTISSRAHVLFSQAISDLLSYHSPPWSLLLFWHSSYCLKDFVLLVSCT